MDNIGERIKDLRLQLKMTQEELAVKMGYKSKSTINKIELGINDVSQTKVIEFAKALNTTPAYLMGWDDKLSEMADILGISLESLINGEDPENSAITDIKNLDKSENELIAIYGSLNAEGQEILLNTAKGLAASGIYKKSNTNKLLEKV